LNEKKTQKESHKHLTLNAEELKIVDAFRKIKEKRGIHDMREITRLLKAKLTKPFKMNREQAKRIADKLMHTDPVVVNRINPGKDGEDIRVYSMEVWKGKQKHGNDLGSGRMGGRVPPGPSAETPAHAVTHGGTPEPA